MNNPIKDVLKLLSCTTFALDQLVHLQKQNGCKNSLESALQ